MKLLINQIGLHLNPSWILATHLTLCNWLLDTILLVQILLPNRILGLIFIVYYLIEVGQIGDRALYRTLCVAYNLVILLVDRHKHVLSSQIGIILTIIPLEGIHLNIRLIRLYWITLVYACIFDRILNWRY